MPVITTGLCVLRGASLVGGGGVLDGGKGVGVGGGRARGVRGARATFIGTGLGGGSGAFVAGGTSTTRIWMGSCGIGLGRTARATMKTATAACNATDVPRGRSTLEARRCMPPYCCFSIWMANFVTPAPLSRSSRCVTVPCVAFLSATHGTVTHLLDLLKGAGVTKFAIQIEKQQ